MENIRAGDVMIPLDQYPHIPYWFSLRQAMVEMEKSFLVRDGRTSLPRVILVFDEKYELMGMVGRRDIMRGLEPEILRERPINDKKRLFAAATRPTNRFDEIPFDEILQGVRARAERPVSDIMHSIETTVDYDDHLFKVIYEMNTSDLSLLAVLRRGRVVGVVRSVDVFHAVTNSFI
jgi:CBS-domain-containing membrane protein